MPDYNEKILARLVNDMHLPEKQAVILLEDLLTVDDKLKNILDEWLGDINCIGDYEAHGFSIHGMMEKYKMTFPAAVLSLDWIIKEPQIAIKSIRERFL